jgi:hypothetical protein
LQPTPRVVWFGALWQETQNVAVNAGGRYDVLLGSASSVAADLLREA